LRSRAYSGESYRWRDASQQPSARRPDCPGRPIPALLERGDEASCASSSANPHLEPSGQGRNDSGRLDPPNRVDGAMDIGTVTIPITPSSIRPCKPVRAAVYARGRPVPENFYALERVFRSQHLANFGSPSTPASVSV